MVNLYLIINNYNLLLLEIKLFLLQLAGWVYGYEILDIKDVIIRNKFSLSWHDKSIGEKYELVNSALVITKVKRIFEKWAIFC